MKYVQKYEAKLIPRKNFSQPNRNVGIIFHDERLKITLNTHLDETATECVCLFCSIEQATPLVLGA